MESMMCYHDKPEAYISMKHSCDNKLSVHWGRGGFMVFNATFNNISAISWQSVLLVEETWAPGQNRPVASHWQTLSHNVVSSIPHLSRIQTHNVCGDRYWLHEVVINLTIIWSRPRRHSLHWWLCQV
jgi:hypothetical protein